MSTDNVSHVKEGDLHPEEPLRLIKFLVIGSDGTITYALKLRDTPTKLMFKCVSYLIGNSLTFVIPKYIFDHAKPPQLYQVSVDETKIKIVDMNQQPVAFNIIPANPPCAYYLNISITEYLECYGELILTFTQFDLALTPILCHPCHQDCSSERSHSTHNTHNTHNTKRRRRSRSSDSSRCASERRFGVIDNYCGDSTTMMCPTTTMMCHPTTTMMCHPTTTMMCPTTTTTTTAAPTTTTTTSTTTTAAPTTTTTTTTAAPTTTCFPTTTCNYPDDLCMCCPPIDNQWRWFASVVDIVP